MGKSAITCRFVFKKFLKDYTCTIEDFYTNKIRIDNEMVELDILDTAGMEMFRIVRDVNIKFRDGFMLVFDVADPESFEKLDSFVQLIKQHHPDKLMPVVLMGNKVDRTADRKVSHEEVLGLLKSISSTFEVSYFECSAQSGLNIDEGFSTLVRSMKKVEHLSKNRLSSRKDRKSPSDPKLKLQEPTRSGCCGPSKHKRSKAAPKSSGCSIL